MLGLIARVSGNVIVIVGLGLLAGVIYRTATGSLAEQLFSRSQGSWIQSMYALGLSLPVPFHVISIGLVLQKRWLPPPWAKAAWLAIVLSGCWLGASLGIRLFLL